MKNKDLFDFTDYRQFLHSWIASQPKKGHGVRAKMAESIGKQSAYLSQVLHGAQDLSLSQAQKLATFLRLSGQELDFFLLLVQVARADSAELRAYFEAQAAKLRAERLELHARLEKKTAQVPLEDQHRYYSAWYYGAARILCAIPRYQTREAVFTRLGLEPELGNQVLDFLLRLGLITQEAGKVRISSQDLFLPKTSDLISRHHANWRLRAIQSLDRETRDELHFSAVSAISARDLAALKRNLVEAIERNKPVIQASPSEELYCVSVDLFKV